MKLYNNTQNAVHYDITAPGMGDCGQIQAGQTTRDMTSYDNLPSVDVSFRGNQSAPPAPIIVTVENTLPGMSVTIGIFDE